LSHQPRSKLLSPMYFCALAVLAAMLVVAPKATPASAPLISLGPITVANGTASLAGTLGPELSGAGLAVNGQPLGVDAAGNFSAVVDLHGASALELAITQPSGEALQFQIPLPVLGVIPGSVLDSLLGAGLNVLPPAGGDGQPVTVSGSVLDQSQLSGLTVNGLPALGLLGPDGSLHMTLPATTATVSVTATSKNGTSQTIVKQVSQPVTNQTAVLARDAVGLRIAGIRYIKKGVLRTHRIRMVVTLKDARGLLVRGATVRVQGRGRKLAKRPRVAHTGPRGRATISLRLRKSAYGKRLSTTTVAKTPSAKAQRRTSVAVPRGHSR
jgi:hypothetical protein